MPSSRSFLTACLLVALTGVIARAQSDTSPRKTPQYPTQFAGKALSEWVPDLKNQDPSVREEAIRLIGVFGPPSSEVVATLIERTTDRDCSPRVRAVMALGRLDIKKEDLPRVIEALGRRLHEDTQLVVRYHAAEGLARYGEYCQPVIPHLITGCDYWANQELGCWEIRRPCIVALAKAGRVQEGPADVRATKALAKALKDPAYEVRLEAILGLGHMGRTNDREVQTLADTELLAIVRGHNKILSIWATITLLRFEHPNVTANGIAKLLKDPDVRTRSEAAHALGSIPIKGKAFVSDLVAVLNDPDPTVVLTVIDALACIGPDAQAAVEPLTRLKNTKETDELVKLAANNAIERISKVQGKR
jgi:HEAT repeat protein